MDCRLEHSDGNILLAGMQERYLWPLLPLLTLMATNQRRKRDGIEVSLSVVSLPRSFASEKHWEIVDLSEMHCVVSELPDPDESVAPAPSTPRSLRKRLHRRMAAHPRIGK